MATGDSDDVTLRLKSQVPRGWFASAAVVRDAVFGGIADGLASAYEFLRVARLQTRMATATGWFLDLVCFDFFAPAFLRRAAGQPDDTFRARIRKEVLRERVTRKGMIGALTDLTGKEPVIFRPANTGDAAAIGFTFAAGAGLPVGSLDYPDQVFITAFRPGNAGVADIAGIGTVAGGIGVGSLALIDPTAESGVTDADIYRTMAVTKPTGVIVWAQLV